jgi:hypothetical protein
MIGDENMDKQAMDKQYVELAQTIANQAEALALGKIPADVRYAHVQRLVRNIETLDAWTPRFP